MQTNIFCCVLLDGDLLLSLFAPPGVGFSVFLCQRSYFPLPLLIFLLVFFLYALPICSGDHGVPGDQHLHHHEMFLRGIGPYLTAMEIGQHGPSAIATSCGGKIFPSSIGLRMIDIVIYKYPLSRSEPALQIVLQVCLFKFGSFACHQDIYGQQCCLICVAFK